MRSGIEHHRGKKDICGFCGQKLPYDLWNKLDAHFNKESEDLRRVIANHIMVIEKEKDVINGLFSVKKDQFYSSKPHHLRVLE